MSEYFESGNSPGFGENTKQLLSPDYSDTSEWEVVEELDDDDDEDDVISEIDESKEDIITNFKEEANNMMINPATTSTPFGNTTNNTTWGSTGSVYTPPTWGSSNNNNSSNNVTVPTNAWIQQQNNYNNNNKTTWGSNTSSWGNNNTNNSSFNTNGKIAIDRTKKVIITDFLDVIAETYQSNGSPGLVPRDIYDLKPRLEVWGRIAAFSPEKIYILSPINLMLGTAGISQAWEYTYSYFCICLSSFLRIPFNSCQVIAYNRIGEPKGKIIESILNMQPGLDRSSVVSIGINSGLYGQSNQDVMAAEECSIDYVDLTQLLNNMY